MSHGAAPERAGRAAFLQVAIAAGLLVAAGPILRHSYLLFHSLTEIGAATISFATFLFAWNTRRFQSSFLVAVGTGALFVGVFEALHCLAFPGMGVLRGYDSNLSPQLWLGARVLQAGSIALGLAFAARPPRPSRWLAGFAAAFAVLCAAIFARYVPHAVRPEGGLTPFKIGMEWALVATFAGCAGRLVRVRRRFSERVFRYLVGNALAMAASDICFTLYSQPTDTANFLGHVLLICGVYWQFKAVLQTGLTDPNEAQFRDLVQAREEAERIQARLAESEERFRVVLKNSPVSVHTSDRELRYTWSYKSLFGLTADQVVGKRDEELLAPDVAGPLVEVKRRVLETAAGERREVAVPVGAERRAFDVTIEPVQLGTEVVALTVATVDVTDAKRAEEALREADRRKTEFLAMLSHELRNPLAPIRNGLYVLERAAPGGEQARRAQAVIDRQVQHLSRLVDDLLDITRITQGKIRLQRALVGLNELVRRTAEDHQEVFARDGIELAVEVPGEPLYADADTTRIAQVIGNLLGNAEKFCGRGGHVALSLERMAEGRAAIRVRDDGAGIPPDVLERLFHPFVQAEKTLDRSRGGLGLGLALVKGLVELHGGSVSARSDGLGKGAEIAVYLPLAAAPVAPRAEELSGAPRPRSRKVLLIEDNVDAAESLKEVLELWGHSVEVAFDGAAGVKRASAFAPDVILCDIGLPGMDGHEVARALRADPKLATSLLIALSGYAQSDDLERSRRAGFDRHLAKPPDLAQLEELLSTDVTRA